MPSITRLPGLDKTAAGMLLFFGFAEATFPKNA
jgi:hypothetical protein